MRETSWTLALYLVLKWFVCVDCSNRDLREAEDAVGMCNQLAERAVVCETRSPP